MFTMVSHDISVFIFPALRDERSEQRRRQTYMGHPHIYCIYIGASDSDSDRTHGFFPLCVSLFLAFMSSSVALQLVVTE